MYSGTTIRTKSGRLMGVHQRIDRLARRNLEQRLPAKTSFPLVKDILHFEGLNGPDGIKRKSPSVDEPWHYINPDDPNDRGLIDLINDHIENLTKALVAGNNERAAFEAAWLAHAVTDGLTPAHHYPLADKIEELWGKSHEERQSFRDKVMIKGDGRLDTLQKNWEYWGSGGVFTAHFMFEWGVATSLVSSKLPLDIGANGNDVIRLEKEGFETMFNESLRRVVGLKMYETFGEKGWTRELAVQTRKELVPEIVKAVTLAWHQAVLKAESRRARKAN